MKEEPMCSSAKSPNDKLCSVCEMKQLCWGDVIICDRCKGLHAKQYKIVVQELGLQMSVRVNLCDHCKNEYMQTVDLKETNIHEEK